MIEGLRKAGRPEEAAELTQSAYERDAHYSELLCRLWQEEFPEEQAKTSLEVQAMLGCSKR
jgi:hypothetical protein